MKTFFIFFLMFIPCASFAKYWSNHDKGWHWYNDSVIEKVTKHQDHKAKITATEEIAQLQKATKEQLNQALLQPSEQNIVSYITLQNALVDKAARFSSMWQKVIWQHPELSFFVNNLTSDVGQEAYYEKERLKSSAKLNDISKRYGLFFYFSSTCAYCQKMSPTIKSFAEYYHFEVMPITIDGQPLVEFPHAYQDNGSTLNLKVEVVPALFLIDKKTKKIIPIGFGLMSFDEIEKRVVVLVTKQEE